MLGVEGARRSRPRRARRSRSRGTANDDLVVLLDVAAVERDRRSGVAPRRCARRRAGAAPSRDHLVDERGERAPSRARRGGPRRCARSRASGRTSACRRRTAPSDSRGTICSGISSSLQIRQAWIGPAPPAGDERELARVEAALDGHLAHALRHVVAGDAVHAGRRLLDRQAHRLGDVLLDRARGPRRRRAACCPPAK